MARGVALVALLPLVAVLASGVDVVDADADSPSDDVRIDELWRAPRDVAAEDLFHGSWGQALTPDPDATYRFRRSKRRGVNPGMVVVDSDGREWSVKQAPHDGRAAEGPIEVVLSRVLSAVGYHQPPVYFLPSFTLADTFGTRQEPGGRFRLDHPRLKERNAWGWQENPFVGTRPYQGLLVILMMFNSSDLKDSNNSIYEYTTGAGSVERWYVVRDLGSALGNTARMRPLRGDPDQFAALPFLNGIDGGYVDFAYRGWYGTLVRDRITPDAVRWASGLLARLRVAQWHDAFRAGGYDQAVAERFIRRLREKIAEGLALSGAEPESRVGVEVPEPNGSGRRLP